MNKTKQIVQILIILALSIHIGYLCVSMQIHEVDWKLERGIKNMKIYWQADNSECQSPFRYRLLTPLILDAAFETIQSVKPDFPSYNDKAPRLNILLLAYFFTTCFASFFALVSLYYLFRCWYSNDIALLGVLLIAATMAMPMSRSSCAQVYSIFELGFFALSCLLIIRKRYYTLGLVIIAATFNRETAIFIPLLFFAVTLGKSKRMFGLGCVYCVLFLITYAGIRYLMGHAEHVRPISFIWEMNASGWKQALGRFLLWAGLFTPVAIAGFKRSPEFVRRAALVIPFYLIAIAVWGRWRETRLLIPLYPIIVPMILAYCTNGKRRKE